MSIVYLDRRDIQRCEPEHQLATFEIIDYGLPGPVLIEGWLPRALAFEVLAMVNQHNQRGAT